ncbi:MAG: NADH-quinone oxidoreductase subunit L, partial [Pontibacter sp.]|nr:NADH-quinone oxidoreductase subunit L [Pontibacter sp.]
GSWAWAQTMGGGLYFVVPALGFTVVLLTAFYMARHMWFVFFGEFRAPFVVQDVRLKKDQEVERVMALPVILLAILSLGIFFSLNPLSFGSSWLMQGISLGKLSQSAILSDVLLQAVHAQDEANHTLHIIFGILSTLLGLAGISWAILKYRNRTPEQLQHEEPQGRLAQLSHQHFRLNEFYDRTFVQPTLALANTLYRTDKQVVDYLLDNGSKVLVVLAKIVAWFDRWVVDGFVWFVGALSKVLGGLGRGLQNGKVQSYYAYSLFGFILLMLYIILF